MEHIAIIKLINKLEEKFPVQAWRVDEYSLWPLIRLRLAFLLYAVNNPVVNFQNAPLSQKKRGIFEKLIQKINYKNRSFYHRIVNYNFKSRIARKGTIAFFTPVVNRTLLGDLWHNRSVDPLADELLLMKKPVAIFEIRGYNDFRKPAYNGKLVSEFDEVFTINQALTKKAASKIELASYNEFLENVKKEAPGVSLKTLQQDQISHAAESFSKAVLWLVKVFQSSGIEICFSTCYYDFRILAINAACKQCGITTIELPHGTHGNTHAAYGKWMNVPEKGYEMLPDVFWCWSKEEESSMNEWIRKNNTIHRAFTGGNPWLNVWKKESDIVRKYDRILSGITRPGQRKILYTLQPFRTMDLAFPPSVREAIRTSAPGWQWFIRLHPRQPQPSAAFEKILQEMNCQNWNIEDATTLPLPAILRHMDAHFTSYSSVVLEAAVFNIPSVVFKNGYDIFRESIPESQLKCSTENAGDILKNIGSVIRLKKGSVDNQMDLQILLKDILSLYKRTIQ